MVNSVNAKEIPVSSDREHVPVQSISASPVSECTLHTEHTQQGTAGQSNQREITLRFMQTKGPDHMLVLPLCQKPYEKEVHCKMFLCQSRGSWDKQDQILSGAYLWREKCVVFKSGCTS